MNLNSFLSNISSLGGMISKFKIFMMYMFKHSASLASLLYRHLLVKICALPFSLKKGAGDGSVFAQGFQHPWVWGRIRMLEALLLWQEINRSLTWRIFKPLTPVLEACPSVHATFICLGQVWTKLLSSKSQRLKKHLDSSDLVFWDLVVMRSRFVRTFVLWCWGLRAWCGENRSQKTHPESTKTLAGDLGGSPTFSDLQFSPA